MAGDWIKMRGNLWDDPRVSKLCDLTGCGEAQVIGGLYWLWATADQHTEDGSMPGLTLRQIDRKTGIPGFGAALCDAAVGWLVDDAQGVVIARFEEHNGTSAKRRCTDAQRKANGRTVSASDADKSRTDGGSDADEKRRIAELEEEKRREEKSKTDPGGSVSEGTAGAAPSAPSIPKKVKAEKAPKEPGPTTAVWASYELAYEERYGAKPVRNGTVNGILSKYVARLPADEAPDVAAFFVAHNGGLYVAAMHAVNLLLRDAEKLRTEWATGRTAQARAGPPNRQEAIEQRNRTVGEEWLAEQGAPG
jgi:hypothetical protein